MVFYNPLMACASSTNIAATTMTGGAISRQVPAASFKLLLAAVVVIKLMFDRVDRKVSKNLSMNDLDTEMKEP